MRSEIKAESFSCGQFGVNGDQVFFTGRTEQRFLFDAAYVKIGKLIKRQGLFGSISEFDSALPEVTIE